MNPVATLVPDTRPHADVARELRAELEAALAPVCAVFDKITAAGFQSAWQLAPDYRGKHVVQMLKIIKEF